MSGRRFGRSFWLEDVGLNRVWDAGDPERGATPGDETSHAGRTRRLDCRREPEQGMAVACE